MLETYFKKNKKRHLFLIKKILKGDYDSAEDVVQEAFTKAIIYFPTYDENRATLATWFNKILFSTLADFQRKEYLHKHEDLDKFYFLEDEINYTNIIENWCIIEKAINSIKDPLMKKVVKQLYILGYSIGDIAIKNNITENNVRQISFRFRVLLHEKWNIDV